MSDTEEEAPTEMVVQIDYGDGSEPETMTVTDGFTSFHPYTDDEKYEVAVEQIEADTGTAAVPDGGDDHDDHDDHHDGGDDHDDHHHDEQAYDPGEHTVAEVEEYVSANPDELEAILTSEEAGKNRVTLVDWLIGQMP